MPRRLDQLPRICLKVLVVALLCPPTVSSGAMAQDGGAPGAGSVQGRVIDATTLVGIDRAAVAMLPRDAAGALPAGPHGSAFISNGRSTITDSTGTYRFEGLAAGAYRLYIRRNGYEQSSLDVTLPPAGTATLSVGLVIRPVELEVVRIDGRAPASNASGIAAEQNETSRLAGVVDRQRRYLSADVRELTRVDMSEAATLGHTDVLRAMQRLPGVSFMDEWSARTVVRGSRWDHNRVYFDDLPLLVPLQALGTLSAVNPTAIGGVFLHPGVRPVSLGGEGVSRIDLRSRAASATRRVRGAAEISPTGISLAGEQRLGALSWSLSGRHSLGDVLPGRFRMFADPGLAGTQFRHAELLGRTDVALGRSTSLEASGISSRDARLGVVTLGGPSIQDWDNTGLRVTLRSSLGRVRVAHTAHVTTFGSHTQGTTPYATPGTALQATTHSSFWQRGLRGEFATAVDSAYQRWALGYGWTEQSAQFGGARAQLYPGDLRYESVDRRQTLSYATLWGERRWKPAERLTVESGLRADAFGEGIGGLRLAPTVQARYAITPATLASFGAGRSLQYLQHLPLVTRTTDAKFVPGSWIGAGGGVAPLDANQVSAGFEQWARRGLLVGASVYARRSSGVLLADPTPGELLDRPLFVTGRETAVGAEVSARKLTGRLTGLLAYSVGAGRTRVDSLSFVSSAARRHAVDATAMLNAARWRLGAGYTFVTGAPYTRLHSGAVTPDGRAFEIRPRLDAPNAQRLPNYSSLDLVGEYAAAVKGLRLTGYLQVQNVLGRNNPTWYLRSGECESTHVDPPTSSLSCHNGDLLFAPVGVTPSFGLRIAF